MVKESWEPPALLSDMIFTDRTILKKCTYFWGRLFLFFILLIMKIQWFNEPLVTESNNYVLQYMKITDDLNLWVSKIFENVYCPKISRENLLTVKSKLVVLLVYSSNSNRGKISTPLVPSP